MFLQEKRNLLEVKFHENIDLKSLESISFNNEFPQIILWYIGRNGLKNKTVEYYRDNIIHPILQNYPNGTFWLVDLVAWNGFKNKHTTIHNSSSYSKAINNLHDPRIKAISSSRIFQDMVKIDDPRIINTFNHISRKKFIKDASALYPDTGIKTEELFVKKPLFGDFYLKQDTSKSYSFFQFVEGCLIVQHVIESYLQGYKLSSDIEIVFILPNDELKYYIDSSKSFRRSIDTILSSCYKDRDFNLFVDFLSVPFGKSSDCRPYNVKDKSPNKNELSLDEIIGHKNLNIENKKRAYA